MRTLALIVALFVVSAALAEAPATQPATQPAGKPVLGVTLLNVADLTTQQKQALPLTSGVMVAEVLRGSAAEKCSLKVGDIITQANGTPVPHAQALAPVVATGKPLRLRVMRPDAGKWTGQYVYVTPSPYSPPAARPKRNLAKTRPLKMGEVGRLDAGYSVVGIARTETDLFRALQLTEADDDPGLTQMVLAGRILLVPAGTRCRMIGPGNMASEIRVIGGEHDGRSGFVITESARPSE